MVIIVSPLFVVNIMLKLRVVSCSKDKVLVDQGVEVVHFDLSLHIAILKNRIQSNRVVRELC